MSCSTASVCIHFSNSSDRLLPNIFALFIFFLCSVTLLTSSHKLLESFIYMTILSIAESDVEIKLIILEVVWQEVFIDIIFIDVIKVFIIILLDACISNGSDQSQSENLSHLLFYLIIKIEENGFFLNVLMSNRRTFWISNLTV